MKKIQFNILHKDGKGLGVGLPDGCIIIVDNENRGLRIALPKSKWKKIFENKQKRWKYYEFVIRDMELSMLLKALNYHKVQKSTKPSKRKK